MSNHAVDFKVGKLYRIGRSKTTPTSPDVARCGFGRSDTRPDGTMTVFVDDGQSNRFAVGLLVMFLGWTHDMFGEPYARFLLPSGEEGAAQSWVLCSWLPSLKCGLYQVKR